jgi:hypothetical protein
VDLRPFVSVAVLTGASTFEAAPGSWMSMKSSSMVEPPNVSPVLAPEAVLDPCPRCIDRNDFGVAAAAAAAAEAAAVLGLWC